MRITQRDLDAVVNRINLITGAPKEPYTKPKKKGGYTPSNIGHYHLDHGYGGVALLRFNNECGGAENMFYGYYSKRDLYEKMQAFIKGIETRELKYD